MCKFKDRDGTIKGGLTISVSFFRGYGYGRLRFGGGGGGLGVVRRMGIQQSVSFCLLSSRCQHLQSANKIIITVNSGPLIG